MKLKEFEDYLYDNYKSDKTIEAYKTDINQFLVWLNKDIALLENRDLRTYTKNLERTCAVSTINRKIAAINQYIVFLNEKYTNAKSPTRIVPDCEAIQLNQPQA